MTQRRVLTVRGIVQGVGFRPFVLRLATRLGVSGSVANTPEGVRVVCEGAPGALDTLENGIRSDTPPGGTIFGIDAHAEPPTGETGFRILPSQGGQARAAVSPDLGVCDACARELLDPADRRYRYPFLNCTACGPRFSILARVPYDRANTTMAGFAMCERCADEYQDPADRRFHAQPTACAACGPRLYWLEGGRAPDGDPIARFAEAIRAGRLVGVRGLGGYHVACDATNEQAVALLRERKRRYAKPLAVMVADLPTAERLCSINEAERALLLSPRKPIVLLRLREGTPIAPSVAPRQRRLGLMLPYTPLHLLLTHELPPLVLTSANVSDAPMPYDRADEPAVSALCDALLTHDRPILRRVDDSVCFVADGQTRVIRRARGFAPEPIELRLARASADDLTAQAVTPAPSQDGCSSDTVTPSPTQGGRTSDTVTPSPTHNGCASDTVTPSPTHNGCASDTVTPSPTHNGCSCVTSATPPRASVLAFGGQLKSTFCLSVEGRAYLSSHMGDLDDEATYRDYIRELDAFLALFGGRPDALACDLHPDYASTRVAERFAARMPNARLYRVQHHQAHFAAVLAEHGLESALGFVWDGSGLGTDGTLWGGELLLGGVARADRVGHLRPLLLPGGEAAVRGPWRTALAAVSDACGDETALRLFADQPDAPLLLGLKSRLSPCATGMGRLFDCIAAIAGLCVRSAYEGQAAMALEQAIDEGAVGAYAFSIAQHPYGVIEWDWRPVVREAVRDRERGDDAGAIAARFHRALVALLRDTARLFPGAPVALGGGVFQNAWLLEHALAALRADGRSAYANVRVPAGDGGLSYGQAAVAEALAEEENRHVPCDTGDDHAD